ncbi:Lsr2 family protein [Microbispora sp. H10670]|uniref:Lsr2 family DNA-binding protein n=1 Tax=Microbispora sp. H10670 TaxID=2729108 RepID=UPI0016015CD4|nr:Lsr2 family protein [Microbispora sp. H10670]
MADGAETPPWKRLQRISEMPIFEQNGQIDQLADELIDRWGMGNAPHYLRVANRDMIVAVLLSLLGGDRAEGTADTEARGANQPNKVEESVVEIPTFASQLADVSAPVVRAWAQQQGIPLGDRGRIPMWVINRYQVEHSGRGAAEPSPRKIHEALEKYGELTKAQLEGVLGRSYPSWQLLEAISSLPNVQISMSGDDGRSSAIFRWVEAETREGDDSVEDIARGEHSQKSIPSRGDSSGPDTVDAVQDFLQLLRGESSRD